MKVMGVEVGDELSVLAETLDKFEREASWWHSGPRVLGLMFLRLGWLPSQVHGWGVAAPTNTWLVHMCYVSKSIMQVFRSSLNHMVWFS